MKIETHTRSRPRLLHTFLSFTMEILGKYLGSSRAPLRVWDRKRPMDSRWSWIPPKLFERLSDSTQIQRQLWRVDSSARGRFRATVRSFIRCYMRTHKHIKKERKSTLTGWWRILQFYAFFFFLWNRLPVSVHRYLTISTIVSLYIKENIITLWKCKPRSLLIAEYKNDPGKVPSLRDRTHPCNSMHLTDGDWRVKLRWFIKIYMDYWYTLLKNKRSLAASYRNVFRSQKR